MFALTKLLGVVFVLVSGAHIYETETGQVWDCHANPQMECVYKLND